MRALKPDTELYACEVETAAPLAASLAAGNPGEIDHRPSFVDGIGAPFLFSGMWELASQLLDGSLAVELAEVASAIRLLAGRNLIIAEGAGEASVAAVLAGKAGTGKVVCVISGGNNRQIEIGAYISRQGLIVGQGNQYKIDQTIQAG